MVFDSLDISNGHNVFDHSEVVRAVHASNA